jgi:sec-independent protein translocase protein TatA
VNSRITILDLFAPTHLFLLLMVILIIFGPSKLGDVGGALGKGIRDFKRAINEPESIPAPIARPTGGTAVETADTAAQALSIAVSHQHKASDS